MFACPTEALVMFPEGGRPPPLKVPEIDENFQTVVAGQYLIGEVAGKPLVKSAANLGRAVVEHMMMGGLRAGALGHGSVDVAIVGSGPGGLSAALTCIQRGLSYVVLEKEQEIASTISRYPKGKLVMAEPYDTQNLSFLPVFDSAKEQLIPIWKELLERTGCQVRQGESVETIQKGGDGAFEIRTTVAAYKAQRVVMSIGTRGKPRTLQVPGENLPKIFSLLDDPDNFRGKAVLVVGGGDSACEAALALADAGAKVMISYRGKGFNRAAPKNKSALEQYASEGRLKAKLGSQIVSFDANSVTIALADGSQKLYPNDAAFVLIGADPPIAWLEKMGVRFVEREHQYQMGKTDDIVRRFVRAPMGCPEDAARAAAQILGGSVGLAPSFPAPVAPQHDQSSQLFSISQPAAEAPVKGPRKWLRSATSIFSSKGGVASNPGIMPPPRAATPPIVGPVSSPGMRKLDAPVPLSEFAKRGKNDFGTGVHQTHTGNGRRDALSAGERTRILRMLRDEGGRQADEESRVHIGAAPPAPKGFDFDFDQDDDAPIAPPPSASFQRPDVDAKPAVVVGIAAAQAKARREKRTNAPPRTSAPMQAVSAIAEPPLHLEDSAPLHLDDKPKREKPRQTGAPPSRSQPKPVPPSFNDEATRQVDEGILSALRDMPPRGKPSLPKPSTQKANVFDEPTRMSNFGASAFDDSDNPAGATKIDHDPAARIAQSLADEDATRMSNVSSIAQMGRGAKKPVTKAPPPPSRGKPADERTRAVDIRNDGSISDVDWDLD